MTDILVMIFCTLGALFALIAAIGIFKMPDFYSRLSVTVKAATIGVGLILVGVSMYFVDFAVTTKSLAIILFLMLTAPIAGFLVGRVAYLVGSKLWKYSLFDDLKTDIDNKRKEIIAQEKLNKENSEKQTDNQSNQS